MFSRSRTEPTVNVIQHFFARGGLLSMLPVPFLFAIPVTVYSCGSDVIGFCHRSYLADYQLLIDWIDPNEAKGVGGSFVFQRIANRWKDPGIKHDWDGSLHEFH